MPIFFTPYISRHRTAFVKQGSEYQTTYVESTNKDGDLFIEPTGKKNMFVMTQEARPLTIRQLIERGGIADPKSFDVGVSELTNVIQDFTAVPRYITETTAVIEKGKQAFYKLPSEVRSEFNNNVNNVMRALQDGTFAGRVAKYRPVKVNAEVKKEVKDE